MCCYNCELVYVAEPATSLQTHTMGRGGLGPAKSEGRHGALSGPQVMLSAERSMRDLEGEHIKPYFTLSVTHIRVLFDCMQTFMGAENP